VYFTHKATVTIAALVVPFLISVHMLCRIFRSHTIIGLYFYCSNIVLGFVGLAWGIMFMSSIEASFVTRALLFVTLPLLFFTLPFGIVQLVEQFDVLCRRAWVRPRTSRRRTHGAEPKVSLHVPIYAEPPHIVIGTLNAISALRYANYEVLVIDNNTKDEALWRPLEAHCALLGAKFRFFHVDPLEGAKAGALNFALTQTAPDASVIGLIDSDYHPHPDFIADLIGHFDDPRIGFVQTPHDYRAWEGNTFLTMCYWEYKAFFHTILVALNERDAALTIGTMCLLRKKAVVEAGGWATWCLTEDSEFAIRVHDIGYSSVYVPQSYGKGLIPERFADYTKQRRRWVSGPVQEIKHHFAHFVGLAGRRSSFTFMQRLHHFHHGWGSLLMGLNIPLLVLSGLVALSMTLQHEVIAVPYPLWISVTILFLSNAVLQWLHYHAVLHCSLKDMVLGFIAHRALSFSVHMATLSTLLSSSQRWRRTSKFPQEQSIRGALFGCRLEIATGSLLMGSVIAMYVYVPSPGLLTMCLIGIAYRAIDYFAAPVVACIATLSQNRAPDYIHAIDTSVAVVS
jgi:cellulose synthase/poly-beta-1,6-N-acetylglucosamine synthase-like glycosyltransferase